MWLNLLLPPLHLFSFLFLSSSSYPPRKAIVVDATIVTSNSFSSSFSTFSNSCNRYLPSCHQRSFTSSMFLTSPACLRVTIEPPSCHPFFLLLHLILLLLSSSHSLLLFTYLLLNTKYLIILEKILSPKFWWI